MRKSLILVSILLASIFFSLDLSPPVDAQGVSPNPTVVLDCDEVGGFDLFTYDGIGSRIAFQCSLENPTQYLEDIDVSLYGISPQYDLGSYVQQSFYIIHNNTIIGPTDGNNNVIVNVDAYDSTNFSVAFWEDYGDIYWDGRDSSNGNGTLSSPMPPNFVTVNAKVVGASGMPCTTCPNQEDNVTMVYNEAIYVKADYGNVTSSISYNSTASNNTDGLPNLQGSFVLELLPKYAPSTVQSFTNHVANGRYDGTVFHRVIDQFMIQGGDIECGLYPITNSNCTPGTGGYSASPYPYEIHDDLTHIPYALSMAQIQDVNQGEPWYHIEETYNGTSASNGGDTLMKIVLNGNTSLAWSFVKITLSVGDNVYTCSVAAGDDCSISQQAGDNDNAWEPGEYIFLSEGTEEICSAQGCALEISVTNNGNTLSSHGGGSQFFIVDKDSPQSHLNGLHSIFGNVIVGYEDIDYISQVQTDSSDGPLDEVVIFDMDIIEWPQTTENEGSYGNNTYDNNTNDTLDSDDDGVPDSEDPFPNDANETHDDDNDGVGNNSDAFPQDANETHDDDGDGVGNNSDDFPQDPDETTDTDGDGVGDNSDADPDDPSVRIPADLEINVTDTALYVLAAAFLLMAVALVVNRRKKPPEVMGASEVYDSDTIWNES